MPPFHLINHCSALPAPLPDNEKWRATAGNQEDAIRACTIPTDWAVGSDSGKHESIGLWSLAVLACCGAAGKRSRRLRGHRSVPIADHSHTPLPRQKVFAFTGVTLESSGTLPRRNDYAISSTGITGARGMIDGKAQGSVQRVREYRGPKQRDIVRGYNDEELDELLDDIDNLADEKPEFWGRPVEDPEPQNWKSAWPARSQRSSQNKGDQVQRISHNNVESQVQGKGAVNELSQSHDFAWGADEEGNTAQEPAPSIAIRGADQLQGDLTQNVESKQQHKGNSDEKGYPCDQSQDIAWGADEEGDWHLETGTEDIDAVDHSNIDAEEAGCKQESKEHDEEDEDEDNNDGVQENKDGDEDENEGGDASARMQIVLSPRGGKLVKILPEDRLKALKDERDRLIIKNEELDGGIARDHANMPIDHLSGLGDRTATKMREEMRDAYERLKERMDKRNQPTGDFFQASVDDVELFAQVSTSQAKDQVSLRRQSDSDLRYIGDDIGTGLSSAHAYVEIAQRPGPEEDGPPKEAVNAIVSRELGISPEKASRLITLGSVWIYEEYWVGGWERIKKNEFIEPDRVLRVFPNPERFSMCYTEDWQDRVKKVDRDFVVVDKPPMLPCFAKISNGRESLGQCMREALNVRSWGGYCNDITDDFNPCHEIDDAVSGLVVLSRHSKAVEVFDEWLANRQVVFEYVALCTANVKTGIYRHYFRKDQKRPGMPKPALYEMPFNPTGGPIAYKEWDMAEMEVVATAPLPGDCAAVRIRTHGTGWHERIRTQLAMLGAPVLNDQDAIARGEPVSKKAASAAGLLMGSAPGDVEGKYDDDDDEDEALANAPAHPLAGAVDEETLRGPYGHKLELLPDARNASESGVPKTPKTEIPVGLHLARIEFGGRVVTCAPPAYWPEGAAGAVAVKLTAKDLKENVFAYLITQGGFARCGAVGGQFGVRIEWLEEHFTVDRPHGLVFASTEAFNEWKTQQRIDEGEKAWGLGMTQKKS